MYAVIMAGGRGTRFWPKSRESRPKQLLNIIGDITMLQATVARMKPLVPDDKLYIVVGKEIEEEVRKQLPDVPDENIIIEPLSKNTASCIGFAAVTIQKRDPKGIMVVLPADHVIGNEDQFLHILKIAGKVAASGPYLVTLGIVPTRPERGYGHIRKGEKQQDVDGQSLYRVGQFVEKPDVERAQQYTDSGEYLWNSGMFVWRISTILDSFRQHMPDLYDGLLDIAESLGSEEESEMIRKVYDSAQSISIDYGVMEKAENVVVLPSDLGWNDVGSWASLEDVSPQDEDGNVLFGPFVGIETTNSIFVAPHKLIAAIGIDNVVVVDTPDALLLCSKERAQDVKRIVERLRADGLEEYL